MGQTLTHGIYLPDEGERNCYAGLAANWQLLDGAVGTVAEHTSQIAGKAPAVHTHSKSDITDLFNSANTWSGDNKYSKTVTVERNTDTGSFIVAKHTAAELGSLPSSDQSLTIAFQDKNDNSLCYARVYYETTGGNSFRIFVRNKYTSGAPSTSGTADYAYFGLKINADKSKEAVFRASLRPYDSTNAYNLGDATYQWNNLYAKRVNTQSVNGINPGALSLPNGNAQDTSWIGDLTIKDGSGYNLKTFTLNGWITINIPNTAGNLVVVNNGCGQIVTNEAKGVTGGNCSVFIPVVANVQISILLVLQTGESVKAAIFAPCLGNV